MLFIISTSNTTNNTQSWSTATSSGELVDAEDTLDDLIDMLDGEESASWTTLEYSTESSSGSESEEEMQEDVQEEEEDKKWFFDFLFWGDDEEDESVETNSWSTQSGTTNQTSTGMIDDSQDTDTTPVDSSDTDSQIESEVIQSKDDGLVKTSGDKATTYKDTSAYDEYVASLPWNNIVAKVWNRYTVWVKALKLNNKYFNQSLWILYSGDTLEQIWTENSYGCFEVRVISSKNTKMNAGVWYVCKKWLKMDTSNDASPISNPETQVDDIPKENTQTPVEVTTYIGDQISVSDLFIVLDNVPLEKWDIIDQVSETNIYTGCFSALVRETDILPSRGKVITACYREIN